jgi:4-phytase / acid phosphatase
MHPLLARSLVCVPLLVALPVLAQQPAAPSASAQERAAPTPAGKLVKFVMLSRHGVRSPIPKPDELDTWSDSPWPKWDCDGKPCAPGQLTPRGWLLAEKMGVYYGKHLASLLPGNDCPKPNDLFFWADVDERTQDTAWALLHGFRPSCVGPVNYFHTAQPANDRIFHPIRAGDDRCKLDAVRAKRDIIDRAGGSLERQIEELRDELATAQTTLRCCQTPLCAKTWSTCGQKPPPPNTCTLTERLATCLVSRTRGKTVTQVVLGGELRIASTFAEILLLEYANGFRDEDVGWGRITRAQMTPVFRLHTAAFNLEQRTPYIAALQGSALLRRILLALKGEQKDEGGGRDGIAPPGAKFVAYVGHDTNIANVAGMLGLSWQQEGYQKDQTPPAGALTFELWQTEAGARNVYVYYVAQGLDDMRHNPDAAPMRTWVPVPGCNPGSPTCSLDAFEKLVMKVRDPNCWQ